MKNPVKAETTKYLMFTVAALGLALRILLYSTGMDGRGLLVRFHWTSVALTVLTVAVLVAVFLGTRTVGGSKKCRSAYPASPLAAAGAFAAMTGIGITTVMGFGEFSTRLHLIIWVLGLCATICMGIIGFCRLTGKTPTFLLYAALCVYFALRMVSGYQNWSADPQLQDYCYYLLAYVTLMLTAYHHAAFHVGVGKHRSVWFFSLMAMYFCIVSLLGTTELYLLLGCGIWAFTNTTRPSARHYRQQRKQDPDGNENCQ